jgi:hypothetical protein
VSFPVKLFTIKGNLVFMNNLYHKVAVASVCTALGFALGANKEAKAATFTFVVRDRWEKLISLDGLGDAIGFTLLLRQRRLKTAEFAEFNISFLLPLIQLLSQCYFSGSIGF